MINIFTNMIGKVFTNVWSNDRNLCFENDEEKFKFYFNESMTDEDVFIESIVGDLQDLVDSPILVAEEVSGETPTKSPAGYEWVNSETWTFYKFATIRGYVDVRWYGCSNGYYSEEVSFKHTKKGLRL